MLAKVVYLTFWYSCWAAPWENDLANGDLMSFPTYKQTLSFMGKTEMKFKEYLTYFQSGETVLNRTIDTYHIGTKVNKNIDLNIYNNVTKTCKYKIPDMTIASLYHLFDEHYPPSSTLSHPTMLLFSLQHAREPLSLTTTLYFTRRFLEMATVKTSDEDASFENHFMNYLLHTREIIYIPIVNIDGYETIGTMKLYYKRKNERDTCQAEQMKGVDLNRNFDFNHKRGDPCDSEEYGGPVPFSEPETRAIRCLTDAFKIRSSVNVHAYGGFWTHPFNCCDNLTLGTKLSNVYEQMKKGASIPIFDRAGKLEGLNYNTNGEADDWLLAKRGIIASGPEVGPPKYSFYPPGSEIIRLSKESYWKIAHILHKTGSELQVYLKSTREKSNIVTLNYGLSSLKPMAQLLIYACPSESFCQRILKHVPILYEKTDGITYTPIKYETLTYFSREPDNRLRQSKLKAKGFIYNKISFPNGILPQNQDNKLYNYSVDGPPEDHKIITIMDDEKNCHIAWYKKEVADHELMIPLMPFHSKSELCELQKSFLAKIHSNTRNTEKLKEAETQSSSLFFLFLISSLLFIPLHFIIMLMIIRWRIHCICPFIQRFVNKDILAIQYILGHTFSGKTSRYFGDQVNSYFAHQNYYQPPSCQNASH